MKNSFRNVLVIITFSLCACFIGQPHDLQGAAIHALLVGDTFDESIGYDCELDLYHMRTLIQEISQHTGMKPLITTFQGQQTTTYKILNYLNHLEVDQDDVLVLYFCMHGYRTPSKNNPWPNLHFAEDDKGIDFNYIAQFGKEKMPRLLISIADTCNNVIPDGAIKTITKHAKKMAASQPQKISENYKKLFLYPKGSITISGSVPGTYSWSFTDVGGAYTLNFLSTLRNTVKNSSNPTWAQILSKTSQAVQHETMHLEEGGQQPQYELQLKN